MVILLLINVFTLHLGDSSRHCECGKIVWLHFPHNDFAASTVTFTFTPRRNKVSKISIFLVITCIYHDENSACWQYWVVYMVKLSLYTNESKTFEAIEHRLDFGSSWRMLCQEWRSRKPNSYVTLHSLLFQIFYIYMLTFPPHPTSLIHTYYWHDEDGASMIDFNFSM